MEKESIDLWYAHVIRGHDTSDNILEKLYSEFPPLISWVGERSCNLSCEHCIFQDEKSYPESPDTSDTLLSLVLQHPEPILIHEGRILRKWHLPILKKLQDASVSIGLIDNGTYMRHKDAFEMKLDWIDISIDGTETVHNQQRRNDSAYKVAFDGIRSARDIAEKVTSLFTVTSLNYHNLYDACVAVIDHIDEFHIIPVSPVREAIVHTETTAEQMHSVWEQVKRLMHEFPGKIFMRMYQHSDVTKIASIDQTLFAHSVQNPKGVSHGKIIFEFQGVSFTYFPKSLSINETMVIDADNWYRLPYSIQYTLKELSTGMDMSGNDISKYSVEKFSRKTDIRASYLRAVNIWWYNYGKKSLQQEQSFFSTFH